jgi:2-dehydropantoate 2-reductase
MKKNGLIIKSLRGTITIQVKATDDPTKIRSADALVLATKSQDTVEALDSVSHLSSSLGFSLSLQNGLDKDGRLSGKFGVKRVIGAATTEGVTFTNYGEIEHTFPGITFFGALEGEDSAEAIGNSEEIARLFNNAGLRAEVVDDIRSAEWGKLIRMASGAVLAVLTRLEYHRMLGNFDLAWCFVRLMREFAEIAKADGVTLRDHTQMPVKSLVESSVEDAVKSVVQSAKKLEASGMTHMKISTLQDVERGRRTELNEILGYPLSLAKKLNVSTPQLDFLHRLINGLDSYLL